MSRGFTGMRSDGELSKRRSAKDIFIRRSRGEKDEADMTAEERFKMHFDKKFNELKEKAMGATRFSVTLPGTEKTENARQLSKSAQATIDKLARDRAKTVAKKKSLIQIKPKFFTGMQGGRIDKNGYIYGPDGQWIAYVNLKTGKVKNRSGFTICKYKDTGFCEFRIANFIAQYNQKKRSRASLYGVHGHGDASHGVYGGDGYGHDTAHNQTSQTNWFWGNNDKPGGGFWG